jgi:hypothetical protein
MSKSTFKIIKNNLLFAVNIDPGFFQYSLDHQKDQVRPGTLGQPLLDELKEPLPQFRAASGRNFIAISLKVIRGNTISDGYCRTRGPCPAIKSNDHGHLHERLR